jgi:hypothetical protein
VGTDLRPPKADARFPVPDCGDRVPQRISGHFRVNRQLLTKVLQESQLRVEFTHVLKYFAEHGIDSCKLLFGWPWGIDYYGDRPWVEEVVAIAAVGEKVAAIEAEGTGRLGAHDLHLYVETLQFKFCHESDIHLTFLEGDEHAKHFEIRWAELDYGPRERIARRDPMPPRDPID